MSGVKSYAEVCAEDRRLVILRFLSEEPDYRMNTSLLQDALDTVGHRESRDVIHGDAAWLKDVGLVTHEQLGPVLVLKLTSRGLDAATGRAIIPGVKRPGPKG
jgi:hypothetical protein